MKDGNISKRGEDVTGYKGRQTGVNKHYRCCFHVLPEEEGKTVLSIRKIRLSIYTNHFLKFKFIYVVAKKRGKNCSVHVF
jgi:hypothetical protein